MLAAQTCHSIQFIKTLYSHFNSYVALCIMTDCQRSMGSVLKRLLNEMHALCEAFKLIEERCKFTCFSCLAMNFDAFMRWNLASVKNSYFTF